MNFHGVHLLREKKALTEQRAIDPQANQQRPLYHATSFHSVSRNAKVNI